MHHSFWKIFFTRTIEVIFIINIAILDILAVRNFPQYRASISQTQTQQIIPTDTPTPTLPFLSPTPTFIPAPISSLKEAYVPLGTGVTSATDWTNVPGVLAYVDNNKYPNIKQVTFEANINVPTANETVWIQLYNMTDEHPVWNSQISMNGATQYIVSPPITLDSGNKLYQVQMKTQLQYPADLTEARIHIVLQ